jgi:DNA-binding MarR family transcriptional regulator
MGTLTNAERLVLGVLASASDPGTGAAPVPMDRIARDAAYCRRHVIRVIRGLEAKGAVRVERRRFEPNRYELVEVTR